MLQLLFFLSYYEQQIKVASSSYLTKFSFLEFGFKKNAQYFINFSKTAPEMVFGYATKDELEEMELSENDQLLCTGEYKLANVQTHIEGGPASITGTIPSKNKLTPFIFSCDKSYVFKIGLSYQNCKKHLDYRCQDAQVYTIFFFFIFLTIGSVILIYFKYIKPLDNHLVLWLLLFFYIAFTFQNFGSFLSLTVKNDWEYLSRDIIDSFLNGFFHTMSFIFSRSIIVVIFIDISYINYYQISKDKNGDLNHATGCSLISVVGASGAVITSIFADNLSIVIPFFISFYCIYIGGLFSFQTPPSFFKLASACYVLVVIFDFYYTFVYSSQPNFITKHVPLLFSIVASIVAQTVFSVFLLIGIFWKGEFYDIGMSKQIPIGQHGSYTNMSSSLNDINEKANQ